MRSSRTATVVALAAAPLLVMSPASAAQLGYVNTTPGSVAWAGDADVVTVLGQRGPSDVANLALAENRDCPGCRTGLAAFQLVLIDDEATVPQLTNLATAVNTRSDGSFVFSDAFQIVITLHDAEEYTAKAQKKVQKIDAELAALDADLTAGATGDQLEAKLAPIKAEMRELAASLQAKDTKRAEKDSHRESEH